ncbi:undecaprenyl-diphosphate phosphatase [Pseudomonadota bacterium]
MDILHAIYLALLQGLTEFLPISSSGHLILLPHLFEWTDQGLAFDVAVHLGSLVAVVTYFRAELYLLGRDWLSHLNGGTLTENGRLAWGVIVATIPVGVAALIFGDIVETELRKVVPIALATIFFGLVIWWFDARRKENRDEHSIGWRDILIIGFAQALALIPGTSRSGITIAAGLAMGLTRSAAARFSFLLSIPVILLASLSQVLKILETGSNQSWSTLMVGTIVSTISAYFCIHFFLKLVQSIGLLPFVIYRLFLGVVLLIYFV